MLKKLFAGLGFILSVCACYMGYLSFSTYSNKVFNQNEIGLSIALADSAIQYWLIFGFAVVMTLALINFAILAFKYALSEEKDIDKYAAELEKDIAKQQAKKDKKLAKKNKKTK